MFPENLRRQRDAGVDQKQLRFNKLKRRLVSKAELVTFAGPPKRLFQPVMTAVDTS